MLQITKIQHRIYEIRNERIMLDKDLAALYETETKVLNLAVKRNRKRFPEDFMFQLTKEEYEALKCQFETLTAFDSSLRFQIETSKSWGGNRYLPYAFTEQGIAMLSGIINSDKAINMNINIMRAFVEIRRCIVEKNDVTEQLKDIQLKISAHDVQLSQIYEAIENLLHEKAGKKRWQEREMIGFSK